MRTAHMLPPIRSNDGQPTCRKAVALMRGRGAPPNGEQASGCHRRAAQPPSTATQRGPRRHREVGHTFAAQSAWRAGGGPYASVGTRSANTGLARYTTPRCTGSPDGHARNPSPPRSPHPSPVGDMPRGAKSEGSLASFGLSVARCCHDETGETETLRGSPPVTGRSPADTAAVEVRESRSWVPSSVVPPSNCGWSDPSVRTAQRKTCSGEEGVSSLTSSVDASNVSTSGVMSSVGQRAIRGLLPQSQRAAPLAVGGARLVMKIRQSSSAAGLAVDTVQSRG